MRDPSGRDARRLAALTLHGLHAGPTANGRFDPHFSVRPHEFAAQLDWLQGAGYRTVTSGDLLDPGAESPGPATTPPMAPAPDPGTPILLTFDGGDASAHEVALPMLVARGMVAEFYIRTGGIGAPGLMNEAQIGELAAWGMSIQSRGHTSRSLAQLDEAEIRDELRVSKQRLESMSGQRVHGLALPGGRADRRVLRIAATLGYRSAVTSRPGHDDPGGDPLCLHRLVIDRATDLTAYASLVRGRGFAYHAARVRPRGLDLPKWMSGGRGDAGSGGLRTASRSLRG